MKYTFKINCEYEVEAKTEGEAFAELENNFAIENTTAEKGLRFEIAKNITIVKKW